MAFVSRNIIASQRDILGLQVCDHGWADAFALADEIATMPFGQNVIAFLDAENGNRMMRDAEYRAVLQRQTVLPGGDAVDITSRLLHGNSFPANIDSASFVPALLTYLSRPMRIALVGGDPATLMQAAESLRRHAPWHDILPIAESAIDAAPPSQIMDRVRMANADILIVALEDSAQEIWIDRHVGPGDARLVLSAHGLFGTLTGGVRQAPIPARKRRFDSLTRFLHAPNLAGPLFLYHALRYWLASSFTARNPASTAKAGSL